MMKFAVKYAYIGLRLPGRHGVDRRASLHAAWPWRFVNSQYVHDDAAAGRPALNEYLVKEMLVAAEINSVGFDEFVDAYLGDLDSYMAYDDWTEDLFSSVGMVR